jgi:SAM-dependent methyltransferase
MPGWAQPRLWGLPPAPESDDLAEFTGERVIPGQVDQDLMNEHLARYAFAARLARGKRVLDAGCGAGYGSAELAKNALSVLGVDQSHEAVAFARENYRSPQLHFAQASVTLFPFPNAAFDLVVAFEVIEHLEKWQEFLLEVRRVLVPTGQFIVSTPNKAYYAETRQSAGPNPFHHHEFEYAEFRNELSAMFPHISLFLENHVEGVVFQPVESGDTAEVRLEATESVPAASHFFVAVCAHRPQTGNPTFVYVPRTGNVLREREQHIALLEAELAQKDEWLEKAKQDLADLNRDHQKLLEMYRAQKEDLEARNQWALQLNQEVEQRSARIVELQNELAAEQAGAKTVVEAYESKVLGLEEEVRQRTHWALETESRMSKELAERSDELARCVELLHQTEKTVEERTAWAQQLQDQVKTAEEQMSLLRASRWLRLGRRFGLGPELPGR